MRAGSMRDIDLMEAALGLLPPMAVALILAISMPAMWVTPPTVTMARFVEAPADVVSCAQHGVRPDGKQDGVVEIRFTVQRSLLASLLLRNKQTYIRLERHNPPGLNETGPNNNVLGIAEQPGATLMNKPGGMLGIRKPGEHHLFAHFCKDGHDKPDSRYRLNIDGAFVPITGTLPN
jgi:hypothetical protein